MNASQSKRGHSGIRALSVAVAVGIAVCIAAIVFMLNQRPQEKPSEPAPAFEVHKLQDARNILDLCWIGNDKIAISVGKQIQFLDLRKEGVTDSVAVNQSGSELHSALAGSQLVVGDAMESVVVDPVSLETIATFEDGLLPYLVYDDRVLIGNTFSGVIAWDLKQYEYLPVFETVEDAKDSDLIDAEQGDVVVLSNETGTRILNAKDFEVLQVVFQNDRLDFRKRVVSEGKTMVARKSDDHKSLEVIDFESKQVLTTIDVAGFEYPLLDFSFEGSCLAVSNNRADSKQGSGGGSSIVVLFDPSTGEAKGKCGPCDGQIFALAWSGDNRKLAVAVENDGESQIVIFNVQQYLNE